MHVEDAIGTEQNVTL